jgi:hypothetical protein
VLNAVELYDQPPLKTDEVGDRVADGNLSTELQAAKPSAAKFGPEALLGIGPFAPHLAGEPAQPRIDALAQDPSPGLPKFDFAR